MRLRDLAAEDEADAGPSGFGREERDEQVAGVRQPGPVVFDPEFHRGGRRRSQPFPSDRDGARGFTHRVERVPDQVDQQLLELIAISLDPQVGSWMDANLMRFLAREIGSAPVWTPATL